MVLALDFTDPPRVFVGSGQHLLTLDLLKAPGIRDGLGSHAFLLLFHLELAIARLQAGQSLQVDLCLTGLLKSFRIEHDGVLGPLLRPLSLHF